MTKYPKLAQRSLGSNFILRCMHTNSFRLWSLLVLHARSKRNLWIPSRPKEVINFVSYYVTLLTPFPWALFIIRSINSVWVGISHVTPRCTSVTFYEKVKKANVYFQLILSSLRAFLYKSVVWSAIIFSIKRKASSMKSLLTLNIRWTNSWLSKSDLPM